MIEYCMKCMKPRGDAEYCVACGFRKNSIKIEAFQLIPGEILHNRYLVGNIIGRGGFGITYIGLDIKLKKRVAIKEFYPQGLANRNNTFSLDITLSDSEKSSFAKNGITKFLDEAQMLAQFDYLPGVVRVSEFFEAHNTAYIVMDYIDGPTLKEMVKIKLFEADKIFELMKPVFKALKRIHEAGIIHRDISPENIMYDKEKECLVLMDFGASRFENIDGEKTLSVVLKKGYAPYEQYSSKGKQGAWTDIYALCATIYKCITGRTPEDSADRMYDDGLMWPSQLGFKISPYLENILKKGLGIRTGERIQSVDELLHMLEIAKNKTGVVNDGTEEDSHDKTVRIFENGSSAGNNKSERSPRFSEYQGIGEEWDARKRDVQREQRSYNRYKSDMPGDKKVAAKLIGLSIACLICAICVLVVLPKKGGTSGSGISDNAAEQASSSQPETQTGDSQEIAEGLTAEEEAEYDKQQKQLQLVEQIKNTNIGNTVEFGNYKGNTSWRILAKNDETALLITRDIVEEPIYNDRLEPITWENCSLRRWLNNEYFNEAFSEEEQSLIVNSRLKNYANPQYGTDGGNETIDKVFMLSDAEVEYYMEMPNARYAATNTGGEAMLWYWWLRSPGEASNTAQIVTDDLKIDRAGCTVAECIAPGVRPVVCVKISGTVAQQSDINEMDIAYGKQVWFDSSLITQQDSEENPIVGIVRNASVGDEVSFGNYKGYTQWKIIEKGDNTAFLLSKDIICDMAYNSDAEAVTWEESSIRNWLNSEYLNAAFDENEQELLGYITVQNNDNPYYSVDGGNDTLDRIVLLSIDEVNRYFNNADGRKADKGDGVKAWWWLRSPGCESSYASYIRRDGTLDGAAPGDKYGHLVSDASGGVRPAILLNFE